jgi:OOP family OmpA-OmpF porin
MKIYKLVPLIGLPVVLAFSPVASQAARPGVYVGASWGAFSINKSDLDDHDSLLKGYGGLQFTDWFALEGTWTDFNRIDNPDGDRFEGDGKGLSAVFSVPIGQSSALFAKAGEFWWKSKTSFGDVFDDADGRDPFWGVGGQFAFNDHLALRVEAERYDVSEVDLDTASVGLQFKF